MLDLSDDRGVLCCKLLDDMGVDVILIEPPGGNSARYLGPFYQDRPGLETSLYWWAYNTNKRSVVLDLQQPDGQALLRQLVHLTGRCGQSAVARGLSPGVLARCSGGCGGVDDCLLRTPE